MLALSLTVDVLKLGLRAGLVQMSEMALDVWLQSHSELERGVGFTPLPLLGALLFLLDKIAENHPVFCCVSFIPTYIHTYIFIFVFFFGGVGGFSWVPCLVDILQPTRACAEAEEGCVMLAQCVLWSCFPLPHAF